MLERQGHIIRLLADQRPPPPLPKGLGLVTSRERDLAVWGVAETLEALGRGGDWEALAGAAALLDRALRVAAVPAKYLHAAATAALGLALKMSEEAERVPESAALSAASGGRLSSQELARMERALLDRLDWNLRLSTDLGRFLHLLASAGGLESLLGGLRETRWGLWRLVRAAVTDSGLLWRETASDLALAILSLELETAAGGGGWLAATAALQRLMEAESGDVIRCREALAARLLKRKLRRPGLSGLPRPLSPEGQENRTPKSPPRRRRRKTLPSSFPRNKTPSERLCVDDLADSLLARLLAHPMEIS